MNDDLKQLQGTWNIVALEMNSHKLPAAAFTGARVVVEGDRFITLAMGATYAGLIETDPSTIPKTFNMKFTDGPEKGNTNFGIYELDGDTWKVCLAITGGPAPETFATESGSGYALEILKRDTTGGIQLKATPG